MWVAATTEGDVFQYSLSTAWDVSTASYDSVLFDASTEVTTALHDLYFKSDGSKMYLISNSTDAIFQYSTVAPAVTWTDPDLTSASYDSVSFSVATQETSPTNIGFNDDGTSMYIIGRDTDAIYQYTLSTAWDLSTASYASKSLSTSGENTPRDFTFNNDGTKIYYVGDLVDTIYQYSLSTAYDISTATSDNKTTSVGSQSLRPTGIELKSDGTKLYVCDGIDDNIYQYSLSTAFDISTASYDSVSFSFSSEVTNTQSIFFSPDGTSLFVCDTTSGNDSVYKYSLSTAWDVSTLSYANEGFSLAGQDDPFGVAFKSDGSKMYMVGNTSDAVYQYSTVATAWTNPDLANASYDSVTLPSTGTLQGETNAYGLTFKNDGTEVYYCGVSFDQIASYTLSTAWDLSTATYNTAYNVGANPRDIHFSSDGRKMFTFHTSGSLIIRHDLTTGWDISTASPNSNSYTPTVNGQIRGGFLNSDGTRMWISDLGNFRSYNLSTGFDLSTASVDATATSRTSQYGGGLHFNPDGTKIFAIFSNIIRSFSLSTAYDISTASEDSDFFSTTAQDSQMNGVAFKSDGSKAYTIGLNNDKIYQYST